MAKITLVKQDGKEGSEITLKDEIFNIEPNESAIYEAVKNTLANRRQGTQSAKTRAEVRGGGRKPYRQKGTGRARQGSITAPNHVGGGVVFAPKPRDYSYKIPKKVKRLALFSALSSKFKSGDLIVVEDLKFEKPKTKDMIEFLKNIKAKEKAMVLTGDKNENVLKAGTNIKGVKVSFTGEINTYEILKYTSFVITQDAVKKLEEVYK